MQKGVALIVVTKQGDVVRSGFGESSESLIKLMFPNLPEEALSAGPIVETLRLADENSTLFVNEPVDGSPVIINHSLEGLLKEMKE